MNVTRGTVRFIGASQTQALYGQSVTHISALTIGETQLQGVLIPHMLMNFGVGDDVAILHRKVPLGSAMEVVAVDTPNGFFRVQSRGLLESVRQASIAMMALPMLMLASMCICPVGGFFISDVTRQPSWFLWSFIVGPLIAIGATIWLVARLRKWNRDIETAIASYLAQRGPAPLASPITRAE